MFMHIGRRESALTHSFPCCPWQLLLKGRLRYLWPPMCVLSVQTSDPDINISVPKVFWRGGESKGMSQNRKSPPCSACL